MGSMVMIDDLSAYRAEPTGTPKGGIVLIHEIWGLVDHIKNVADRYAAEGYLVIAPDILSGVGITPEAGLELMAIVTSPDEAKRLDAQPRLREAFAPIHQPAFAAYAVPALRSVVDVLAAEPGIDGRIAVTGFCFGGTYSFALAAADHRVRAAMPFYGQAPADLTTIGCPVLAFYGENDPPLITALPGVVEAAAAAGLDLTIQVYPGAGHAFFNDTSRAYVPEAAADAWTRGLAFLEATLT